MFPRRALHQAAKWYLVFVMPSECGISNGRRFKRGWIFAPGKSRTAQNARVAAIIGLGFAAVSSRGISAPAPVIVDAISEPFADDSMTRQSTSSLYQLDSLPPAEPLVSAPLLSPEAVRTTSIRRHRRVHHQHAIAREAAPAPKVAAKPPRHRDIALRFFTWWNHLVHGHSWAQVPFAPNDKNPNPEHQI